MQRRFASGGFLTFSLTAEGLPSDRQMSALNGEHMSMESEMSRASFHAIDRAGWIFGLGTLIGLLASSGYLLFE